MSVLSRTTPIDKSAQRPRAWDDAPLRIKVLSIAIGAAVSGTLIGIIEVKLGFLVWPMCIGLTGLNVALLLLTRHWIVQPLEKLIDKADELERAGALHDVSAVRGLPVARTDEVGRLARLIHNVSVTGLRKHYEANQLRRTLDHRVSEATRQATTKMRRIAMRDPLTDLGNRRFLDENLEPLLKSVLESDDDLICVMLDMDNFKTVNDTLGHAVGDELLISLGGLIRATTREEDYNVRLGGDEFVILMPVCPLDRAREFSHRLRALMHQSAKTILPESVPVDLSIGVASVQRDQVTTGHDLLEGPCHDVLHRR